MQMMYREDVQPLDSALLARLHMQASPTSPGFGALSEFATSGSDSASITDLVNTTTTRHTLSSSASVPLLSDIASRQQQLQATWLANASGSGAIASISKGLQQQQQQHAPFLWSCNSDVSGCVQTLRLPRSASASELSRTSDRSVRGGIPSQRFFEPAEDSRSSVGGLVEPAGQTEDDKVTAAQLLRFSNSGSRRSSDSSGSGCVGDSKQRAGAGLMEGRIRGGMPTSAFLHAQALDKLDEGVVSASWTPMMRSMSMPSTNSGLCVETAPAPIVHTLGCRSFPQQRSASLTRSAGQPISLNTSNLLQLDRSLSASRFATMDRSSSSLTALALSAPFASLPGCASQPRMFRVRPSASDLASLLPIGISASLRDTLLSAGSSQHSASGPSAHPSPRGSYTLGELARDLEQGRLSGVDRGLCVLGERGGDVDSEGRGRVLLPVQSPSHLGRRRSGEE
ncbi:MAG: hypothetical protein WDW38_006102 [Sanguina aurantia]